MSVKVVGISASPRRNSNSELLLGRALAGAEAAGADIEIIRLSDFQIGPCIECNRCYKDGRCWVEDDFQLILAKILEADRLIFATPIFFMTVCAHGKLLIDRCQCLWAQKNVLNKPLDVVGGRHRKAMVIAVGGSKSKKMFESIRLTMKYYLDVIEMQYWANLFVNKIEAAGQINKHPSALKEAFRLGGRLVVGTEPAGKKPIEVVLT